MTAILLAAYTCSACQVAGREPEESPGVARCWNCGETATVTARVFSHAGAA